MGKPARWYPRRCGSRRQGGAKCRSILYIKEQKPAQPLPLHDGHVMAASTSTGSLGHNSQRRRFYTDRPTHPRACWVSRIRDADRLEARWGEPRSVGAYLNEQIPAQPPPLHDGRGGIDIHGVSSDNTHGVGVFIPFTDSYRPTDTHTPNGPGGAAAGAWFPISYGAAQPQLA
jgi:hypothetical protein